MLPREAADMNERNAGLWVALLLCMVGMVVAGAMGVSLLQGAYQPENAGQQLLFLGIATVAFGGVIVEGIAAIRLTQRLIEEAVG